MNNVVARRSAEVLGMLAVGEGIIGALAPRRHVELWRGGPRVWSDAVEWFADRPTITRAVALAGIAGGVWLMLRASRP